MPGALRYAYLCLRYPQFRDFIDMGYGIAARSERCATNWSSHLAACSRFQSDTLSELEPHGKVLLLGGGRLLDVDLDLIGRKFTGVVWVDADPGALRTARKKLRGIPSEFYLLDITGALKSWTEALSCLLRSAAAEAEREKLCAELLAKLATPQVMLPLDGVTCIYSLNLLSQIPVYWRERVHLLLGQYWKLFPDDKGLLRSPLEEGLEESLVKLERQHLALLNESGADRILLTTDVNFIYYRNGVRIYEEAALYTDPQEQLTGYSAYHTASWRWDIAPQMIEQKDYGVMHDVRAFALARR